jgi:hypothetical protein
MMTLFEVSTLEMWPDVMFNAIDSQGVDLGPKRDNRPEVAIIFVVFIFLTTFFVMNLFISVIVDKFNYILKKKDGSYKLTPEQKEWVKMQRIMLSLKIKVIAVPPNNQIRLFCFNIVQSNAFELMIIVCIVLNTIFLCLDYYGKGPDYN